MKRNIVYPSDLSEPGASNRKKKRDRFRYRINVTNLDALRLVGRVVGETGDIDAFSKAKRLMVTDLVQYFEYVLTYLNENFEIVAKVRKYEESEVEDVLEATSDVNITICGEQKHDSSESRVSFVQEPSNTTSQLADVGTIATTPVPALESHSDDDVPQDPSVCFDASSHSSGFPSSEVVRPPDISHDIEDSVIPPLNITHDVGKSVLIFQSGTAYPDLECDACGSLCPSVCENGFLVKDKSQVHILRDEATFMSTRAEVRLIVSPDAAQVSRLLRHSPKPVVNLVLTKPTVYKVRIRCRVDHAHKDSILSAHNYFNSWELNEDVALSERVKRLCRKRVRLKSA